MIEDAELATKGPGGKRGATLSLARPAHPRESRSSDWLLPDPAQAYDHSVDAFPKDTVYHPKKSPHSSRGLDMAPAGGDVAAMAELQMNTYALPYDVLSMTGSEWCGRGR
jgi:hypothetical protein